MGAAMGRSYTERRRGRRPESRTRRRPLGAGPPGPAGVPGPVDRRPGVQRRPLGWEGALPLPLVLLPLPAGAAADVFDRRRLLLTTQTWMLLSAAALCVATVLGGARPTLLAGLAFRLR